MITEIYNSLLVNKERRTTIERVNASLFMLAEEESGV